MSERPHDAYLRRGARRPPSVQELVAGPFRCYRKLTVTPRPEDEEDWTGEPPEGRHPRGSADPGFWRNQRQAIYATSLLGVVIVLAIILILVLG